MTRILNIGIVGLGRLGYKYAYNLVNSIAKARVIAACSTHQLELSKAKKELHIPKLYTDYEAMLESKDIDAIFVLSPTNMHATHIIKALEAGKHVFCEKPLALTAEACSAVETEAMKHAHLSCVVGFVRRFDASYQYAKEKIRAGMIGAPFMIHSQTVDKDSESGFQLDYVQNSGGIFHDFNVHDIDLVRWLMEAEFKSVYSIGGAYKHKEFEKLGDADNVLTTCTLSNGGMATIAASRTAMHGHDTYTEIRGTEGSLLIGRPSAQNRVEIYDQFGARRECVTTFWDRFAQAFLTMSEEFIDSVLENRKLELTIEDAVKATDVAIACTQSFQSGRVITPDAPGVKL